jgi:hypothetical protein
MTSVLRRYAQKDPKTGYFTAQTGPIAVWRDVSGETSHSLMDISGFNKAFDISSVPISSLTLFKDLGRQIVIYDSDISGTPHVALMRQLILVKGYNIEGISDIPPFSKNLYYICTWNDGSTTTNTLFPLAPVARTG